MKYKGVVIEYCINISEGATNGDVIKSVFPNIKITSDLESMIAYSLDGITHHILKSWWNAPYKRGGDNEK